MTGQASQIARALASRRVLAWGRSPAGVKNSPVRPAQEARRIQEEIRSTTTESGGGKLAMRGSATVTLRSGRRRRAAGPSTPT